MADNRVFNVNGEGETMLLATLELAFMQAGKVYSCRAWEVTKKGLILSWGMYSGATPLPSNGGMTAKEILPIVLNWLSSVKLSDIEMEGWDANAAHDGDNSIGWRVFCEDWGHVCGSSYAICAIKPAYMWHGK